LERSGQVLLRIDVIPLVIGVLPCEEQGHRLVFVTLREKDDVPQKNRDEDP
jgi:hypothetical protein